MTAVDPLSEHEKAVINAFALKIAQDRSNVLTDQELRATLPGIEEWKLTAALENLERRGWLVGNVHRLDAGGVLALIGDGLRRAKGQMNAGPRDPEPTKD